MLAGRLIRGTNSDRNMGRRPHALSCRGCGSEDENSQCLARTTSSMDEQRVWISPEGIPIASPNPPPPDVSFSVPDRST